MGGRCRLRWLSFLERPVIYFARDQADRLSIDRLAAYPCSRGNLWEPSEVLPSMRSLRIGASRLRAVPVAVLTALVAITLVPVPAALASSGPTSTGSAVRTAASQAGRVTSFAGLGEFKPLSTETFGEGTLSVNPARPGVVAWCAGGSVAVQGLHSETEVPTTAAIKRIASWLAGRAGTQYRMSCQQVAVGASAGQVFASFVLWPDCTASHTPSVINASFGMYTADNGEAWSFVPLPKGATESSFNVFNYGPGGTVQASFSPMPRGPFEVTADGGRRGSLMGPQAIRCPALGPCAFLSSSPPSVNCDGFSGRWASLDVSLDGGRKWSSPLEVVGYQSYATLVALSANEALLVSAGGGTAAEPVAGTTAPASSVMLTVDRGRSWQALAAPSPAALGGPDFGPDIAVLPDGDLLHVGPSDWQLLRRGSTSWCEVRDPAMSFVVGAAATFTITGGKVWWLDGGRAKHVSPSSIGC